VDEQRVLPRRSVRAGNANEIGLPVGRVQWNATNGQTYLVRVAGTNGSTGQYTLFIDTSPVVHNDTLVPLAYNWNGIVHAGENGQPDAPNGYRSISDRGLYADGGIGAINSGLLVDSEYLPFQIINQAGALDIVHLGLTGSSN